MTIYYLARKGNILQGKELFTWYGEQSGRLSLLQTCNKRILRNSILENTIKKDFKISILEYTIAI